MRVVVRQEFYCTRTNVIPVIVNRPELLLNVMLCIIFQGEMLLMAVNCKTNCGLAHNDRYILFVYFLKKEKIFTITH